MFRLTSVWSGCLFALTLVGVPTLVSAAPVEFTGPYTVSVQQNSDPGLVINTQPIAAIPLDFTLNAFGDLTGYFDLFKIWTDETTVNKDDTYPDPISVKFTFTPSTSPTRYLV